MVTDRSAGKHTLQTANTAARGRAHCCHKGHLKSTARTRHQTHPAVTPGTGTCPSLHQPQGHLHLRVQHRGVQPSCPLANTPFILYISTHSMCIYIYICNYNHIIVNKSFRRNLLCPGWGACRADRHRNTVALAEGRQDRVTLGTAGTPGMEDCGLAQCFCRQPTGGKLQQ